MFKNKSDITYKKNVISPYTEARKFVSDTTIPFSPVHVHIGALKLPVSGRLEVLSAVVMKSSIFWDITPCSPLKVNPTFRRNMSQSSVCHLLVRLILQP
jgi:hypothetical protein